MKLVAGRFHIPLDSTVLEAQVLEGKAPHQKVRRGAKGIQGLPLRADALRELYEGNEGGSATHEL
jgi:hypothetical protein